MIPLLELLATFSCALFAGAALYITLVEHPTRMKQETKRAAEQWVPSYAPAARIQAPLAVISFVAGTIAWLAGGNIGWLMAALLIGLVVPFTLLVIKPTNDKLLEQGRDLSSRETRELLERWGRLHAVRTVLSLVSLVLYLWLLAAGTASRPLAQSRYREGCCDSDGAGCSRYESACGDATGELDARLRQIP